MRYKKQILLKEIGEKGQKKLNKSIIAVIGLGGLGSNSANLLARAGVNLILIDRDKLEFENLQRQNIYTEKDVGNEKAKIFGEYLKKVNSEIKIEYHVIDINEKNIDIIKKANLVLDCTDNLETRFFINEYCTKNKIPWIYAAVLGTEGMIISFNGGYCFNCIFKKPTEKIKTTNDLGLINTIPYLIASLQVTEAIKILLTGQNTKEIIRVNIWNNNIDRIKIKRDKNCKICNK
jgi:molybdopterin-synthase adenylyltransferase